MFYLKKNEREDFISNEAKTIATEKSNTSWFRGNKNKIYKHETAHLLQKTVVQTHLCEPTTKHVVQRQ